MPFLTMRGRKQAERMLRSRGELANAWFFGGYGEAERVCLFLLPEYLVAMLSCPIADCTEAELTALLEDEVRAAVCAVRVRGSGYRVLGHRDYLGSMLGLGLERDALGDIAVQNDREAVVFCSERIADFLLGSLTQVGSDTVTCTRYTPDDRFTDGKRYEPVCDTVASERLDCVVAALTNLSRDDAQSSIRAGLVEVDFEPRERVDLLLEPPVWISVRGYGRYRLLSFDGQTKKGRLRMRAEHLI